MATGINLEFLNCPKCRTMFENPQTLECGDNICRKCLDDLVRSKSLKCPCCQAQITPGTETPLYIYNDILCFLKPNESSTCPKCAKEKQKLIFSNISKMKICEKCNSIEYTKHKSKMDNTQIQKALCPRVGNCEVYECKFTHPTEVCTNINCAGFEVCKKLHSKDLTSKLRCKNQLKCTGVCAFVHSTEYCTDFSCNKKDICVKLHYDEIFPNDGNFKTSILPLKPLPPIEKGEELINCRYCRDPSCIDDCDLLHESDFFKDDLSSYKKKITVRSS